MIKKLLPLVLIGLAGAAVFPDPAVDADRSASKARQSAMLAGGCFWCTEAVFEQLIGVDKVISGYAGGDAAGAHYEIVGAGRRTMPSRSRSSSIRPRSLTGPI